MNFCEDCGSPLTPSVLFCENCGAKINIGAERGVSYTVFDVSKNISGAGSLQNHINLLKTKVSESHPKHLFILGSSDVVPSAIWKNEASDSSSDGDVSSDLPYATLDIASPFRGQQYNFGDCICVGRLPGCDFENYFNNVALASGKVGEVKTFGMSALVWSEETRDIYKKIKAGPEVKTSPECTKDTVRSEIPCDTNLLLFNLHGSNQTEFWYGQEGSNYPEAVSHNSLADISNPYFLAVEACYGAYYEGRTANNSVLLSALEGKCISFLGSSRIAFGTPTPEGTCADIICGEFLRLLKSGMSAGEAFNTARTELMKSSDAETIKTLAEFSLYGDPSVCMNQSTAKSFGSVQGAKSFSLGIHIPLPDVRRAVRREIATVDAKIAQGIESFVYEKYADLNGVKPVYYRNIGIGKSDMNAVFTGKNAIGAKIVSVCFSENGTITKVLESK